MLLEKPLGYLLCQSRRVYKNRVTSRFKENLIDLSLDEFIILLRIHLHSDGTQQKLADHLQKDKSIVLRQINALIEKEYVIRSVDKNDKRKKNLILTANGLEVLELSRKISKQVSDELLAGISREDRIVFERVVETIRANAGIEDENCNCK
jgi:DNA-binding MarR family transcriptional regulator